MRVVRGICVMHGICVIRIMLIIWVILVILVICVMRCYTYHAWYAGYMCRIFMRIMLIMCHAYLPLLVT